MLHWLVVTVFVVASSVGCGARKRPPGAPIEDSDDMVTVFTPLDMARPRGPDLAPPPDDLTMEEQPDLTEPPPAPCANPGSQACKDCLSMAQGMNGVCSKANQACNADMDMNGRLGCHNLITCLNGCAGNQACENGCITRSTASAQRLIQTLLNCISTACPSK